MSLFKWLVAWLRSTERKPVPHYRNVPRDHFDKFGNYIFKDRELERFAAIAKSLDLQMTGVTFATPVTTTPTHSITSFTISFSGVTSGQPIVLFVCEETSGATLAPTFSDNFSTSYTYTELGYAGSTSSAYPQVYAVIMTGGAGTSGTVTVSGLTSGASNYYWGMGASAIGASTASGTNCVDAYSLSFLPSGQSGAGIAPLVPSTTTGGAIALAVQAKASGSSSAITSPGSPWGQTTTPPGTGWNYVASLVTQGSPSESALSATWTFQTEPSSTYDTVFGCVVLFPSGVSRTPVTFVSWHDTGNTGIATGSAGTVAASAPASGNQMLLTIWTSATTLGGDVASVSSSIGTFYKIGSTTGTNDGQSLEHWVCLNTSGSGTTATVTLNSGAGNTWWCQAIVVSGAIAVSNSYASSGNGNTIQSPQVNMTTGTFAVTSTSEVGTVATSPGPWTDYGWAIGPDVAYFQGGSGSMPGANWGTTSGVWYSETTVFYPNVSPIVMNVFTVSSSASTVNQFPYTNGYMIIPIGVTTMNVQCWGAGGQGVAGTSSLGGAGGGGGEFAQETTLAVTPGALATIEVGQSNNGPTTTSGIGNTFFSASGSTLVVAYGGGTSSGGGTTSGGTGSTNTINYAGGAGAGRSASTGGGGGSSAGTGAAGNAGANPAGGTAVTGGGPGGTAGTASVAASGPTTGPGGGAGGGGGGISTVRNNPLGANGQLIISWATATGPKFRTPTVVPQAVVRASVW